LSVSISQASSVRKEKSFLILEKVEDFWIWCRLCKRIGGDGGALD